jgi:hypothetical protein
MQYNTVPEKKLSKHFLLKNMPENCLGQLEKFFLETWVKIGQYAVKVLVMESTPQNIYINICFLCTKLQC